jgi:hypothetical protein
LFFAVTAFLNVSNISSFLNKVQSNATFHMSPHSQHKVSIRSLLCNILSSQLHLSHAQYFVPSLKIRDVSHPYRLITWFEKTKLAISDSNA